MKEQLISLKTAKLAKEKGFIGDESSVVYINWTQDCDYKSKVSYEPNCFLNHDFYNDYEYSVENFKELFKNEKVYNVGVYIPTQSLLQKWLREVHNIHIVIQDGFNTETLQMSYYPVLYPFIKNKDKDQGYEYLGNVWKNTYEEALEIGLQEAFKLIK